MGYKNSLQNPTKEQIEDRIRQYESFMKSQHLDPNEVVISRELLDEVILTLEHARTFIVSWNRMHPAGVELYDECIKKLKS